MTAAPRRAFVVSHTHWDREWYLTFPRFRVQLLETVDAVLDLLEHDPAFQHFCLDGQTLPVEDYLAARPGQEARLRELVGRGRLALGPWSILPDEFLVSGEATVRNLQVGHATAARLGGVQKVGYLPDTFGHLPQMPQILQQAGIDSFLYWRGHGDEHERLGLEWWWEAPDGSRVLAVNQEDGYVNAAALGHAELWHAHTRRERDPALAVAKVGELFARMAERSRSQTWLLSNGCDHHGPQRELGAMLAALREAFPDTEFVHGSFTDFLTVLRADLAAGTAELPVWRGELLGGKTAPILSGVWSARMPLKQRNAACQDLLAHQLEPLLAYAHFIHGQPHHTELVDLCWRKLLENHPHDSICGCSVDQVHRDMQARFAEVEETGTHLLSRTLEHLLPSFGPTEADDRPTLLAVANPSPWRRDAVVDRLVILQPFGYDLDRLQLLGPDGEPVPMVVRSRRQLQRFWGVDYRAELHADGQRARLQTYLDTFADRILRPDSEQDAELVDTFLEIQFLARDLPACGHAVYHLTDRPAAVPDAGPGALRPGELVRADGPVLENEHLRVTVHPDGRLDLVDKASGREWPGLNRLEDTEDAGDEYDWSHAARTRTIVTDGAAGVVQTVEDTGLAATLRARFDLVLPVGLQPDRQARSEETVACPVEVSVRLTLGSDLVDIRTRLDNRAEDHRLRAWFPTGIRSETVHADGQFLVVARAADPPAGLDWVQPHPGTYPQQTFSAVADAGGVGLGVLVDGLPEMAPRREEDGTLTIQLTLLRAVGWLSRDDFPTRRHTNAGPTLPTPDAQCPGPQVFRYGLAPLRRGTDGLPRRARLWLDRPFTHQGVVAGAAPAGGLIELRGGGAAVSALRRHPRRDTLLIRLWNPTDQALVETLRPALPIQGAWLCDLLEERQEEVARVAPAGGDQAAALAAPVAADGPVAEVAVPLLPHRIVTVELDLGGRPEVDA